MDFLERFNLLYCKPIATPTNSNEKLQLKMVQRKPMQKISGVWLKV